ncbi:MAG: hypothetical protein C3F13_09110 [Anaerolineales bacterium]|nr:MAG: hypothetical protein C3F13_09110 [Anaerolineales bacterium]
MGYPHYPYDFPISAHFPIRHCIAPHACPCRYFGDPVKACSYSPGTVTKYQKRISGWLTWRRHYITGHG